MSEEMVAKYREGFDAMAATSVRLAEMVKKADERIRELEAALDSDPDGSGYWRFWSKKASEQAESASSSQARLSEAVKVLEEAIPLLDDAADKLEAEGMWGTSERDMANRSRQFLDSVGREK